MKQYIAKQKDKVYLIVLDETVKMMEKILDLVVQNRIAGKNILFVGPKWQLEILIKQVAEETNLLMLNQRWIGGTFTNFKEIRKRINYFKDLEAKTKEMILQKNTLKRNV
jgi:small subunit ribosomal protein S2